MHVENTRCSPTPVCFLFSTSSLSFLFFPGLHTLKRCQRRYTVEQQPNRKIFSCQLEVRMCKNTCKFIGIQVACKLRVGLHHISCTNIVWFCSLFVFWRHKASFFLCFCSVHRLLQLLNVGLKWRSMHLIHNLLAHSQNYTLGSMQQLGHLSMLVLLFFKMGFHNCDIKGGSCSLDTLTVCKLHKLKHFFWFFCTLLISESFVIFFFPKSMESRQSGLAFEPPNGIFSH